VSPSKWNRKGDKIVLWIMLVALILVAIIILIGALVPSGKSNPKGVPAYTSEAVGVRAGQVRGVPGPVSCVTYCAANSIGELRTYGEQ
jgi:hypothetical protein